MKKAVILGERQAALVEVSDPQPKEDWVLVKVHAAPMCTDSFSCRSISPTVTTWTRYAT